MAETANYVRYIDRTRDYYLALGYATPDRRTQFEDVLTPALCVDGEYAEGFDSELIAALLAQICVQAAMDDDPAARSAKPFCRFA